jgi:hypothetical protein
MMTPDDRAALVTNLRALVQRNRRLAELHASMGHVEKAEFLKTLASLEEERAARLERTASLP